MKKYVLSSLVLFTFFSALAQENNTLQVYTRNEETANATAYYYTRITKELDRLTLENKVMVYRDEEMKQAVDPAQYKAETKITYNWQVINPETPEDPYNLVDTFVERNMAIRSASSLRWKEQVLEIKTNNNRGEVVYYLELREIEKQNIGRGYTLLKYFSFNFGEVNPMTILEHSGELLHMLSAKLYENPGITPYKESGLYTKLKTEDLKRTQIYHQGEVMEMVVSTFPANSDSINGIVLSYEYEANEEEIEMEVVSIAPTYKLGKLNAYKPWYWASESEVEEVYTDEEWNSLLAIQSYSIRKKVFANFEYLEE
ncbi:MAG TPA: hypothetical protein DIW47_07300 [Bacteroidetes bacterium]|nr:hypothetical protein [Bacteroidota bacterium]